MEPKDFISLESLVRQGLLSAQSATDGYAESQKDLRSLLSSELASANQTRDRQIRWAAQQQRAISLTQNEAESLLDQADLREWSPGTSTSAIVTSLSAASGLEAAKAAVEAAAGSIRGDVRDLAQESAARRKLAIGALITLAAIFGIGALLVYSANARQLASQVAATNVPTSPIVPEAVASIDAGVIAPTEVTSTLPHPTLQPETEQEASTSSPEESPQEATAIDAVEPEESGAEVVQPHAEESQVREQGEDYRIVALPGGTEVTQRYVPAGSFQMGEISDSTDERPVHTVELDAYWIDQTEVTNAQFAEFVSLTGYVTSAEKAGGGNAYGESGWGEIPGANWRQPRGSGSNLSELDSHPVVLVSWADASEYCAWAGGQLPTEAQWEFAARGSSAPLYPWGNDISGSRLNYCDINCPFGGGVQDKNADDGYRFTSPAGSYQNGASWIGALDMSGNVWEWVQDWYDDEYYGRSGRSNPAGPSDGIARVLRGGSWSSYPNVLRATNHDAQRPDVANSDFGFRCVADVD